MDFILLHFKLFAYCSSTSITYITICKTLKLKILLINNCKYSNIYGSTKKLYQWSVTEVTKFS